jgi:mRNA interferase RelE/StbE
LTYEVRINESAIRDLDRLSRRDRERLVARIEALADDPRPHGVRPLAGNLKGYYRLRVGEYRIAYSIDRVARVVEAWRVGTCESFYERLRQLRRA